MEASNQVMRVQSSCTQSRYFCDSWTVLTPPPSDFLGVTSDSATDTTFLETDETRSNGRSLERKWPERARGMKGLQQNLEGLCVRITWSHAYASKRGRHAQMLISTPMRTHMKLPCWQVPYSTRFTTVRTGKSALGPGDSRIDPVLQRVVQQLSKGVGSLTPAPYPHPCEFVSNPNDPSPILGIWLHPCDISLKRLDATREGRGAFNYNDESIPTRADVLETDSAKHQDSPFLQIKVGFCHKRDDPGASRCES
ncbi:hypothetical protein PIB30_002456 [Stylosanthes scabra]|uniref:Uncharacterized protein n=1 Tax=Stylosanthes scabra TaxID=79078 RepID=A0ABU6W164_9FABA|nr:hypothetical protein [Stylosanthes scabra]